MVGGSESPPIPINPPMGIPINFKNKWEGRQ